MADKQAEGNGLWRVLEDRFPSGTAGGFVTKNKKFCQRQLRFTPNKVENIFSKEEDVKSGKTYFLAAYDIILNEHGCLKEYYLIKDGEKAKGTLWYAYVEVVISPIKGWHNEDTYVDTLNKREVYSD